MAFTGEMQEFRLSERPDRMVIVVPGLSPNRARAIAEEAVREARRIMPKSSGYSANRLQPLYGKEYAGLRWADSYVFFQDHGINPFTMRKLAGKTIPMWIDDPTGQERAKNPKAKTRVTITGKTQVLIFRKAAPIGARKTKYRTDPITGIRREAGTTPMSYPGAPGRINVREAGAPNTTPGRVAGAIAAGNGGVRWRHPGLQPRMFLNRAMSMGCQRNGVVPPRLYIADAGWRSRMKGMLEEVS